MTVFVPDNLEPYLTRICLIEEIAQALGPANDLYGLGPSIFNDDGAHVWPTRLDHLMLAVLYAPELSTGLGRAETRAAALAAFDRLNPEGRQAAPRAVPRGAAADDWTRSVREAFDRRRPLSERRRAAERAVATAERRFPGSALHCRALMAEVRLARGAGEHAAALDAANRARPVCATAHGQGDIRLARLALDRAEALYRQGEAAAALAAAEGLAESFAAHGLEERLVALYALQAAGLRAINQGDARAAARRNLALWGAYALGRDHDAVARWAEARAGDE